MNLGEILNKNSLSKEDIVFLLKLTSSADINLLLEKANSLRNEVVGKEIRIIGNIRISNFCQDNCLYCSQREDNFLLERFRLSADKIIAAVKRFSNMGVKEIILRSGHDNYFDSDMISYIIYSIKQINDISVTLSLCERDFEEYSTWNIAGADSYILNHVTANPRLFSICHNGNNLNKRIDHLKRLKEMGYKIGTGSIIGLPTQRVEDIADDILLSRELGVNIFSLKSFTQMDFTSYHNNNRVYNKLVLKAVAAARFAVKELNIPVYSSLESGELSFKEKMLHGGANIFIADLDSTCQPIQQSSDEIEFKSQLEFPSYKNKSKGFIKSV